MQLISIPGPYDFKLSTERFRLAGDDLANLWQNDALHRVIGGEEVRIEPVPGGVQVAPSSRHIEHEVRTLLGETHDVRGFAAWTQGNDPVLAELAAILRGYRPPLTVDPFETLITLVSAQSAPGASATALRNRFIERYGVRVRFAWAFPTRQAVREQASVESLVALGFSEEKAACVLEIAKPEINFDELASRNDTEVKHALLEIPGLGEWAADWFLARHLGRPQAWPATDGGLRKALARFYLRQADLEIEDARAFGIRFSPFQNLAAHYLMVGLRKRGVGRR